MRQSKKMTKTIALSTEPEPVEKPPKTFLTPQERVNNAAFLVVNGFLTHGATSVYIAALPIDLLPAVAENLGAVFQNMKIDAVTMRVALTSDVWCFYTSSGLPFVQREPPPKHAAIH